MGCTCSLSKNKIEPGTLNASDEVRQCKICADDSENVFFCEHCQKHLCLACCQHFAKRENPFYHSSLVPVLTDTVQVHSSKAFNQKVRCGTVAQHGQLVFLTQLFYQDEYCSCCENTFKWKLCYQHDKPLYITKKRQHSENESFVFPGDICFVQTKRKLYLTLPCQRMVYKLTHGGNFHEAFRCPLGGCFGISEFNGGLALSVQTSTAFLNSKWQIQFVDFKGNVSRRIQNDSKGEALFEDPMYLTSNKDKNILFVSDHGKNSIMAFDESGSLMFQNHGISIISPLGIAADMYNNIYVACGKKIIQIDKGGKNSKELIAFDMEDKIVSVCIDHHTNTLTAITEWGHVTSFKFE